MPGTPERDSTYNLSFSDGITPSLPLRDETVYLYPLHGATEEEWIAASGAGGGNIVSENLKALGFPVSNQPSKDPFSVILETRAKVDPTAFAGQFRELIGFESLRDHWRVKEDRIGLKRYLPGRVERYFHKRDSESKKGKDEAAHYGIGNIDGHRFVAYIMNWDYFYGTLSEVAGERFCEAAEYAREHRLPLIALFSSAGARQQEGNLSLKEMNRMTDAARIFLENTDLPYLSVCCESWGGTSGSAAMLGDIIFGVEGSNMAFAGTRLVERAEGKDLEPGTQSAEMNFINRTIDVLVKTPEELRDEIGIILKVIAARDKKREKMTLAHYLDTIPAMERGCGRAFSFTSAPQFMSAMSNGTAINGEDVVIQGPRKREGVQRRLYLELMAQAKDPLDVDFEFFLTHVFQKGELVRFYNGFSSEHELRYPAVAAAVGLIGDRPFLVIGNPSSYRKTESGEVRKVVSSPVVADYEQRLRMLDVGERWKLPLISFVDTWGAYPGRNEEFRGLSRIIAKSILRGNAYKEKALTFIKRLGSGGGLAMATVGKMLMLEDGVYTVAEANSATAILYNEKLPDLDKVLTTAEELRMTAKDQLEFGLIHGVMPVPQGGSRYDPWRVVEAMRNEIIRFSLESEAISPEKWRKNVEHFIRNLRGGIERS